MKSRTFSLIALSLCTVLSLKASAQSASSYSYEKTETVNGASQEELYSRIKLFIADQLHATSDNILFDRQNKILVAQLSMPVKDASGNITQQNVDFKTVFGFANGQLSIRACDFGYKMQDATGNTVHKSLTNPCTVNRQIDSYVENLVAAARTTNRL